MKTSELQNHLLNSEKANQLAEYYHANNYAIINRQRTKPDSNEYRLSLELLESYIGYVKETAASLGITEVGIKIKMGQFPPDEIIDPRQNEEYKGYQMVFLAPFTTDSGGAAREIPEIDALDYMGLCPPNS